MKPTSDIEKLAAKPVCKKCNGIGLVRNFERREKATYYFNCYCTCAAGRKLKQKARTK